MICHFLLNHQRNGSNPIIMKKAGHDDHIFDCEEEVSTKSLKHLNDMKSLNTEMKASKLKPLKSQEKDCQEMGEIENLLKKAVIAERVCEPTMLVINFPRQSTLPLVSELKAKFARFGPLDQSTTLMSWKSSQCQIVFKCKYDVEAAYVYAAESSYLFGNVKVYYQLQTLGSPTLELGKQLVEEAQDKLPQSTSLSNSNSTKTELQPKSYLKKPPGDEVRSTIAIPGKTPHVKFMLVGDESSVGKQLVIGSNIKNLNNNHPNGPSGDSSSSFATVNIVRNFKRVKNFQKVAPSSPPFIRLLN
jgi:DNA (cytosine-5)-methyltransferase 3A